MTASVCDARCGVAANPKLDGQRAGWSGVFAMALCVFALIASEFMPVSLLSPMASDLHVSEGMAGQGLSISAILAVLTSLSISTLARAVDRKTLLLTLTGLMSLSGAVIAFASSYATYMVGRALIGIAIGGFWSMSAAIAMRLVPTDKMPRALAIYNGGNALATVVAAPLGSYLGSLVGWRGAFLCLVPVALIAAAWQGVSVPAMPASGRPHTGSVLRLFRSRRVALGMLAVSLFFMGQFTLFTYVRPFLETVTKVDAPTLSMILLSMGGAGFIGTLVIGRFLTTGLYRTLAVIPILMSISAVALIEVGHHVAAVVAILGIWSLVATAAPVGWWMWVARTLPDDAEAGGGLMVAVIQLAIGSGSMVGGWLFDTWGYNTAFAASAGVLSNAAFLVFVMATLAARETRRSASNSYPGRETSRHRQRAAQVR